MYGKTSKHNVTCYKTYNDISQLNKKIDSSKINKYPTLLENLGWDLQRLLNGCISSFVFILPP